MASETLETIERVWSCKIPLIRDLHCWDRLDKLKMSSVQRRHKRYAIIYTYNILENWVVNNEIIKALRTK